MGFVGTAFGWIGASSAGFHLAVDDKKKCIPQILFPATKLCIATGNCCRISLFSRLSKYSGLWKKEVTPPNFALFCLYLIVKTLWQKANAPSKRKSFSCFFFFNLNWIGIYNFNYYKLDWCRSCNGFVLINYSWITMTRKNKAELN